MPTVKEWSLKTNDDGNAVVDGNKVVFIDPEGKEVPLDPPAMYGKIISLNKENKSFRDKVDGAGEITKLFDGVENIPEWVDNAKKAIETVENFNDKDWMKADKVEKLKSEMSSSYEQKLDSQKKSFQEAITQKDQVVAAKDSQINKLLITNNFAVHPLFGGQKPLSTLTPDMAEAYFSKHFQVEVADNGVDLLLRAYNDAGRFEDPIYSRENPGEFATFEEAMNELWEKFPGKDKLMNASKPGSGSQGGAGDFSGDEGDLGRLKAKYAEAQKAGDAKTAITLKNQIFRLEQGQK